MNSKPDLNTDSDQSHREWVLAAVAEYECRLVRYAQRLLKGSLGSDSIEQAKDIVQHVFLKLCQQDREHINDRLAPWLFKVCRNKIFDEQKRHSSREFIDSDSTLAVTDRETNPQSAAVNRDLVKAVRKLINVLPTSQREAIDLWASGLSNREIAEVMSKTETAVRILIHRALKSLKNTPAVKRWNDDDPEPDRDTSEDWQQRFANLSERIANRSLN